MAEQEFPAAVVEKQSDGCAGWPMILPQQNCCQDPSTARERVTHYLQTT
jgi:hypothetical protein